MKGTKERLRTWILSEHPEWFAMRLWASSIFGFFRPRNQPQKSLLFGFHSVLAGPFSGMNYAVDSIWSEQSPKILGTYERELHPYIERIISGTYDQFINIGAAEGYYFIGISLRLNFSRIIAIDPLRVSHRAVRRLGADNGITSLIIKRWLSKSGLNELLAQSDSNLLIIDCEGGEAGYLHPIKIPNLRSCDILAEVHDFMIENLTDEIAQRFEDTHRIVKIPQSRRLPMNYPSNAPSCDEREMIALMNEKRPKMLNWLYLESRMLHPEKD